MRETVVSDGERTEEKERRRKTNKVNRSTERISEEKAEVICA